MCNTSSYRITSKSPAYLKIGDSQTDSNLSVNNNLIWKVDCDRMVQKSLSLGNTLEAYILHK